MILKFSETLANKTHCNCYNNQQLTTCLFKRKYSKRHFVTTSEVALIFLSYRSIERVFEIVFLLFIITKKQTFDHLTHRLCLVAIFQNNPFTKTISLHWAIWKPIPLTFVFWSLFGFYTFVSFGLIFVAVLTFMSSLLKKLVIGLFKTYPVALSKPLWITVKWNI